MHRAKMEGSYRAGGVFERPDGAENSSVLLLCSASLFTQGGTSNHKINPQVKVTEHCHRRHLDDPGKPDPAFTLNNSKKNLSSRKKTQRKKKCCSHILFALNVRHSGNFQLKLANLKEKYI